MKILSHPGNIVRFQDMSQQDEEMNRIVQYHSLICDLHRKIEGILSGPMLVHLLFLLISVGSPLAQLLFVSPLNPLPPSDAVRKQKKIL